MGVINKETGEYMRIVATDYKTTILCHCYKDKATREKMGPYDAVREVVYEAMVEEALLEKANAKKTILDNISSNLYKALRVAKEYDTTIWEDDL